MPCWAAKIAVASGADKAKVLMQLDKVGLLPLFDPHIFSGHDLPRTKPFPDVYLAARRLPATRPAPLSGD